MTKKLQIAVQIWFVGIFILLAIPTFGQQDSSLSGNDADSVISTNNNLQQQDSGSDQLSRTKPVDTKLTNLQLRVGNLAQQIDSLQGDRNGIKKVGNSDTLTPISEEVLNRRVQDITLLKRDIRQYRQEIDRQKKENNLPDSDSSEDGQIMQEVRALQAGVEDSLLQLDKRLDNLLDRVVSNGTLSDDSLTNDSLRNANASEDLMQTPTTKRVITSIRRNLDSDKPINEFFDYPAWSGRILLILLTIGYLYWMFLLGRKEDNSRHRWVLFKHFPIWIPILKSFVFFLILLPLTSYIIPIVVIQLSYLVIFIFLYILLYTQFSVEQKRIFQVLFVLYLLLIAGNLIISEAIWSRAIVGLLNVAALWLTWRLGKQNLEREPVSYIRPFAKWIILLGFALAIINNALGYIHAARVCSIAASVGLIQALALRAFCEMILRDVEQQYQSVTPENVLRRFDLLRMLGSFRRLLSFLTTIIAAIVLINNLAITEQTSTFIKSVMLKDRPLGGITFNYANLLIAIFVIWGANWIQKNLKHLLNDPSSDELQVKRMSLFPLFRLILVIVSFFIAISILGLGLDKLTVIVGALTVGIGFGLQNIINNLVSGVILIFEKPFKIGDYIELADKKGQVLEIGIRSSVLQTDQGAKVIIPNADLFSGRLVNWTFSNTDIRVNMDLSITGSSDIENVKDRLKTRLKNDRYVDKTIPMKVYTKDIQADAYKVSIQVGVKNVRQIERFRSQFLEGIKQELSSVDVGVSSV